MVYYVKRHLCTNLCTILVSIYMLSADADTGVRKKVTMKVLNSYEKRQGGYDVNDVINKLSDIEQASVRWRTAMLPITQNMHRLSFER